MAESSKGLELLRAYNSSEESDDEKCGISPPATKRKAPQDWILETTNKPKKQHLDTNANRNKLPLPSSLKSLFKQREDEPKDNPKEHEGRIRSFPHERGNWSTFVYIPYIARPVYSSFVDVVVECCKEVAPLKPIREPHVSLTRTVVLRHHWIDSFVDSVKKAVQVLPSFPVSFGSVSVYCNEERTRTFVGLTLSGHEVLMSAVKALDICLTEFKLPTFYKEPSFHMSVAWCVGDKTEVLQRETLFQLQVAFGHFMHAHLNAWTLDVNELHCKYPRGKGRPRKPQPMTSIVDKDKTKTMCKICRVSFSQHVEARNGEWTECKLCLAS